MNNILVFGNIDAELESIAEIFWQAPGDSNVLVASEEQAALNFLTEQEIALVVYDLSSWNDVQNEIFSHLTHMFPYIPSIALVDKDDNIREYVLQNGAGLCFTRPFKSDELWQGAHELIETATSGTVKGFPIHSLLQMFKTESKTCTLKIQGKEDDGLIFVKQGVVVAAETSNQKNEDAIYAIITWEDAIAEILYFNLQRQQEIKKPLISLIMEAFRLKDERDSLSEKQESQNKPRLELKHISTAGNRLSLDIGAKIKLEFDDMESQLTSSMVGMVPDKYLLVSTPTPFPIEENAINSGNRITVKYLHMGRLCMFKTHLLKSIVDPYQLLFLGYPSIIHYHELRRAKRTSILIPCTTHPPSGETFNGVLIDLSRLGCLCQIKAKRSKPLPTIDINTEIQIRCLLPGVKQDPELCGVVKNINKSSSEIRMGIEFINLQSEMLATIDRYLYSVRNIVS